jgi:3-deoxy-7-phosphoheptulonate synthase
MMIVMTPGADEAQVQAVRDRLATTGVHVVVMPGELTTAIGAIGDPQGVAELGLEGLPGVDRVVPISRPYKLAAAELGNHEPTSFEVGGRRIGGGETFTLIAGPCTVESHDQTLGVARAVRDAGAAMLRGGAFKPRTSPFAFKGLGVEALEILSAARAETGLPVVTELLDTQHAEAIAEHADVVQIGARNMQNYALLEVAGKLGKPVLLKRGLSSSLDELLQAGRLRPQGGQPAVVLCERGIRTFETATRFTLDLGAVPWLKLTRTCPSSSTRPTRPATGASSSRSRAPRPRSAPTGSSSRSTRTPRAPCATARRRSTPRGSPSTPATSPPTPSCSASASRDGRRHHLPGLWRARERLRGGLRGLRRRPRRPPPPPARDDAGRPPAARVDVPPDAGRAGLPAADRVLRRLRRPPSASSPPSSAHGTAGTRAGRPPSSCSWAASPSA